MACDYCEKRMGLKYMYREAGVSLYVDEGPRILRLVVAIKEGSPMLREIPISYCPRCGQKLGIRTRQRKEFIAVKGYATAKKRAPWAVRIAAVDGGFLAFESLGEFLDWRGKGRPFDRRDYERE